jgi:hypothetical protein
MARASNSNNSSLVWNSTTLNSLVVGGTDDQDTASRADDVHDVTQWGNPSGGDRELPHIVAPARDLLINGSSTGISGCSFATPQVTAAGALLEQVSWRFHAWPELKRAVLLAGANENVHGDVNPLALASTDDRDGVGEMNIYLSELIGVSAKKVDGGNTSRQYGYDYGALTDSDFPPGSGGAYSEVYIAKVPAGANALRVVLAWDGTACPGNTPYGSACSSSVLDADLDLHVCKVGTTQCTNSTTYDNSYEMVQISNVSPNDEFNIVIREYGFNSASTFYAVAWAADTYN